MSRWPVAGVGVILFRDERAEELLLVRRGRPPAQGQWAPPGGKIEAGETVRAAAAREVLEECGLRVTVPEGAAFTVLDRMEWAPEGELAYHFILIEVVALCEEEAPLRPGDDAAACRWWPVAQLHEAQPQVAQLPEVVALARRWLSGQAGRVALLE